MFFMQIARKLNNRQSLPKRFINPSIIGFLLLLLCISSSVPFPSPALSLAFQAEAVRATDGDTIVVRSIPQLQLYTIRLYGIDAPEKNQPYGQDSKKYLAALIAGQTLEIDAVKLDRYHRTVAWVYLPSGTCINNKIVESGNAWWYYQYAPKDEKLRKLEQTARKEKVGLWADENAIAPWDWRTYVKHKAMVEKAQSDQMKAAREAFDKARQQTISPTGPAPSKPENPPN